MSFIEMPGLADVKEDQLAAEGRYSLVIDSAKLNLEKHNLLVVITIESDDPDVAYANMFHNISLIKEDDDDQKRKFKLLFTKRFLSQFGIDSDNGLETEAFSGCRASGNIKKSEYEGKWKNELVLESLPDED